MTSRGPNQNYKDYRDNRDYNSRPRDLNRPNQYPQHLQQPPPRMAQMDQTSCSNAFITHINNFGQSRYLGNIRYTYVDDHKLVVMDWANWTNISTPFKEDLEAKKQAAEDEKNAKALQHQKEMMEQILHQNLNPKPAAIPSGLENMIKDLQQQVIALQTPKKKASKIPEKHPSKKHRKKRARTPTPSGSEDAENSSDDKSSSSESSMEELKRSTKKKPASSPFKTPLKRMMILSPESGHSTPDAPLPKASIHAATTLWNNWLRNRIKKITHKSDWTHDLQAMARAINVTLDERITSLKKADMTLETAKLLAERGGPDEYPTKLQLCIGYNPRNPLGT
jgi:hypothetical protein